MGPSVKFVLAIIDSISKKKMGVNFFSAKLDTKGGGVPRASCLWTQKIPILIFEYFPYAILMRTKFNRCPNKYLSKQYIRHDSVFFSVL